MSETALKVEIENLGEVKRKLRIEVPAADVSQEMDQAYRQLGKKAKVKGFRPGKVPRSVLELYYGKQVEQEVSDALVRRSLSEALKEHDLKLVNLRWPEPPPSPVAGQDYRYTVEVEVTPEFTVEGYQGLTLEAPEVEVADAEVDARLEEIRQSNALLEPVEGRPVQEGDYAVLDYQAYFTGQPVAGGKAEGTYVQVGSGNFNPDFERNLIGLTVGEEARFVVALPQDFANPLLAGKEIEFQVKLLDIKEKSVPDLDDGFAQSLGGNFKTLADLREAVREDIIKQKERERQAYLEHQAAEQLLSRHPFEAPPSLIGSEQENIMREQMERMSQYGVDMAQMDNTRMLEAVKPMAERRVKTKLLLDRIADQEGITVDDGEVDATLARMAVGARQDVAQVKKFYQEHDLLGPLRRQLRHDKAMKLLLEQSTIVAPAPKTEQEETPEQEKE